MRLKRAALYAVGASSLMLAVGCETTAAPEYGILPCFEDGSCSDNVPGQDAAPDVTVGDAFMGPDVASADASVEAAPDAPMGADNDGSGGGDAGEGGPLDGGRAIADGSADAGGD